MLNLNLFYLTCAIIDSDSEQPIDTALQESFKGSHVSQPSPHRHQPHSIECVGVIHNQIGFHLIIRSSLLAKKNNPFERTRHTPQLPYLQHRASYTHMRNHITFFSLHHKRWTQPLPPSDKRGYQGNRALTGDTFRDRHISDIPTSCRNSTFFSHV